MTAIDWVVVTFHSRTLHRGQPFVPMPEWVNAIRSRAKRGVPPTDMEVRALHGFLKMRWDLSDV